MKRVYDFEKISNETGFNTTQIEKVCRISDLLEDISSVPFMRKRLALYGGTALSFIHFDAIERLSVDIDFNYRHIDDEDWGNVRDKIDDNIKTILYTLGYSDDDIRINPSYPLNRFTAKYTNHLGRPDEIKIETGYMRRIPVLENDMEYDFYHVGTHNRFRIMTPVKEELFSNKWCTMLYRGSPRDLFDVYQITQETFNLDKFRMTAVLDSLMRGYPRLIDIQAENLVKKIKFDISLLNVLYKDNSFEEKKVHEKVANFSINIINQLSNDEEQLIKTFFNIFSLDADIISSFIGINKDIKNHPMLLRQINELSK